MECRVTPSDLTGNEMEQAPTLARAPGRPGNPRLAQSRRASYQAAPTEIVVVWVLGRPMREGTVVATNPASADADHDNGALIHGTSRLTAGCVDIDPHTPCMRNRSSWRNHPCAPYDAGQLH